VALGQNVFFESFFSIVSRSGGVNRCSLAIHTAMQRLEGLLTPVVFACSIMTP